MIVSPHPGTAELQPGIPRRQMAGPGTAELQLGIVMANPGTAELQLGISSCRKADASVAGVFKFRMASFSFTVVGKASARLMPSWSSAVPEGPSWNVVLLRSADEQG